MLLCRFQLHCLEVISAVLLLRKAPKRSGKFAFSRSVLRIPLADDLKNLAAFSESLKMVERLRLAEQGLLGWVATGWDIFKITQCSIKLAGPEECKSAIESDGVSLIIGGGAF